MSAEHLSRLPIVNGSGDVRDNSSMTGQLCNVGSCVKSWGRTFASAKLKKKKKKDEKGKACFESQLKTSETIDLSADSDGVATVSMKIQVNSNLLDREKIGSSPFVMFVLLTQQKMNISLCLTALHVAQSGTGLQPFSGDQPLPCPLLLLCVTGSLPSFCMNVLHSGLCC